MAREDVILNFVSQGTRTILRNLGDIRSQSLRASRSVNNLDRALTALGGFLTIRALQQYADTFTLLQNRLRLVTESTSELNLVTEELFGLSQRTYSSFEQTGTLYARLARSVSTLNITQRELLDITEGITQATALSSPTIQAAQAGLVQLAQAVGSDRLQGDELRSILENIPRVGQAIADGLGVPFQELRKLGAEGKLVAQEVLGAIESQLPIIQAEFEKFVPSISFALTQLDNAFLRFIGRTNEATGVTRTLAQGIKFIADNFDTLATAVLTATGILAGGALAGAIGQIITAVRGLGVVLTGVGVVLLANPIGATIAAIAASLGILIGFRNQIRPFANDIITLGDAFSATWSLINDDLATVGFSFDEFFDKVSATFSSIIDANFAFRDSFLLNTKDFFNFVINLGVASFKTLEIIFGTGFDKLIAIGVNWVREFNNTLISGIESTINAIGNALDVDALRIELPRIELDQKGLQASQDLTESINTAIHEAFSADYIGDLGNAVIGSFEDVVTRIKNRAAEIALAREAERLAEQEALNRQLGKVDADGVNKLKETGRSATEVIRDLTQQYEILNTQIDMATDAGVRYAEHQRIINELSNNNQSVTAAQSAEIFVLLNGIRDLNDQMQRQDTILKSANGSQEDYFKNITAIDNLLTRGLITLEQYNKALDENRLAFLNTQTDAASGIERSVLNLENTLRNSAGQMEELFTSAFKSAEDAFVQFTQTGEFSFSQMADAIIADLTRIAFREALANIFFGGSGAGASGGAFYQAFSTFGGYLSSFFGGGGSGVPNATAAQGGSVTGTSPFQSFARGGSFGVDSSTSLANMGGTDNRLIAFRARDGERVTVTPPGGSSSEGTVNQFNFNITTPDADSFGRSQAQLIARAAAIAERTSSRNN